MREKADATYVHPLGEAVIESWGMLSQETQQLLFECAVRHAPESGDDFRHALAIFLHDLHPRTEEDTSGGR